MSVRYSDTMMMNPNKSLEREWYLGGIILINRCTGNLTYLLPEPETIPRAYGRRISYLIFFNFGARS